MDQNNSIQSFQGLASPQVIIFTSVLELIHLVTIILSTQSVLCSLKTLVSQCYCPTYTQLTSTDGRVMPALNLSLESLKTCYTYLCFKSFPQSAAARAHRVQLEHRFNELAAFCR